MRIDLRVPALLLAGALAAAAHAKPSPEDAERIIHFYLNGQDEGPLLVATRVCADVHLEGELKNECTLEFPGNRIGAGETAYLWMMLLVPKGTPQTELLLQLNYEGVTRETMDVPVAGSVRYRTWKKIELDKPGAWEAKLFYDHGAELELLGRTTIHVDPPAPPVADAPGG